VRRGVETFWEWRTGLWGVRGVSVQGVPVIECGEVMDGEQGFREFEECEESVCREFL
jgi:hypothetical protein